MKIELSPEDIQFILFGLDGLLPTYRRPTTEYQNKAVIRLRERLKEALLIAENPSLRIPAQK